MMSCAIFGSALTTNSGVYLDPPFNSKRDDNLLFKSPKRHASEARVEAVQETWHRKQQPERAPERKSARAQHIFLARDSRLFATCVRSLRGRVNSGGGVSER
jgi:hypothetical protein